MSENRQIDGRDLRDGGWFWTQQELLYVFTPLIGPEASWLYMVLCKMIPDKVNNPLIDLTIRSMQRSSGLSIGTVHRKLAVLIAIGMVEEIKGGNRKPSVFKLVNLKKLAALGTAELQRRLSVPPGNTAENHTSPVTPSAPTTEGHGTPVDGADTDTKGQAPNENAPDAPAASGENTVPVGNSGEKRPVDGALFQKQGGTVPETGGDCSSEVVPFKVLNLSILKTSPLPLSQAKGGMLPSLVASADGTGKNKKLSRDGRGAADLLARSAAVTKVLRECGISDPRMAPVIDRAMGAYAALTDEIPDWNAIAERMTASYSKFVRHLPLLAYRPGPRKFFALGLWDDERRWPWDDKKLNEKRRL